MIFSIPKQITQGDRVTWCESLPGYDSNEHTLSCFIRGASAGIDLTGIGIVNTGGWEFNIPINLSASLAPGNYKTQFLIFESTTTRKTLGSTDLIVLPSFENLNTFDPRSLDQKELELITEAIAKLVSGAVAEYRIGDRMMRYQDLAQLTNRQKELRNRIAVAKNRGSIGGRNVGIRFAE